MEHNTTSVKLSDLIELMIEDDEVLRENFYIREGYDKAWGGKYVCAYKGQTVHIGWIADDRVFVDMWPDKGPDIMLMPTEPNFIPRLMRILKQWHD